MEKIRTTQIREGYLEGQLLIAAPGMLDPRFYKTVLYMCSHNKEGAMGIIINRVNMTINFNELLSQLDMKTAITKNKVLVYDGGPVANNRGFVLHSSDFVGRDTQVNQETDIAITSTVDVISAIAKGTGPKDSLVALGYAGWNSGQLDNELTKHGWIFAPASYDLLFQTPHNQRWEKSIQKIGINPGNLVEYTGFC